jgi:hypothetical protein
LLADRGLDARAIQNLAFDFGSCHGFHAHRLNRELIALLLPKMPGRANEYTSADQKLLLRSLQTGAVPSKSGPIRFLPIVSDRNEGLSLTEPFIRIFDYYSPSDKGKRRHRSRWANSNETKFSRLRTTT